MFYLLTSDRIHRSWHFLVCVNHHKLVRDLTLFLVSFVQQLQHTKCFSQLLYMNDVYKQTPTCWISFNSVLRHSAECVLGYRCRQFGQCTGTDQGTLRVMLLYSMIPCLSFIQFHYSHFIHLCLFLISLSLTLSLSAGWTRGRGGRQSEDRPAESQGGGWSQPAICCQPLHCSVRFFSLLLLHSCFYIHLKPFSQAGLLGLNNCTYIFTEILSATRSQVLMQN